jgi:hypothetical protein
MKEKRSAPPTRHAPPLPSVRSPSKQSLTLTAALALVLLPAWTTSGLANAAASRGPSCSVSPQLKSPPSITVRRGSGTRITGSIRVLGGHDGWTVQAAVGRLPGYVSQAFSASRFVSIEFCLRAPRGDAATILRLQPGGVSLVLDSRASVELVRSSRRVRMTATRSRHGRLATSTQLVRLVVDGAHRRATLYVNGSRKQSLPVPPAEQSGVQIGSLGPAGSPSAPSSPSTISLSNVTVSSGTGTVIPVSSGGTGSTSGSDSPTGSAPWPGNPFSPTSFWNTRLAPGAPLDPSSQVYVNEVVRQVKAYGPWINTTSYSVPVYVVPANEATQHVTLDTWGPDLQSEFDAVPIPRDAKAAAGTDEHMAVWQPSTDKMWEFWQMHQASDGWHARWGGEMDDVSTDPGYFTHTGQTKNWGATATGLPLLGGLVTEADLQRGYIDHALAISLVETARANWSWPAQRTDGGYFSSGITPVPEGTRFRLDPNLNIASLNLPPIDRMLAQAAQTYGIVVRDKAGAVVFYGQDPINLPSNPWPAAFGNKYPNNVLAAFPWSHLEALQTTLSCCWSP